LEDCWGWGARYTAVFFDIIADLDVSREAGKAPYEDSKLGSKGLKEGKARW
jgi:hypothetical protein